MTTVLSSLYIKPVFRWLVVILWMSVIYAFSNQANSGEVTEQVLGEMNVPIRKCAHMFEYAMLFWLTRWASISFSRPPSIIVPGFPKIAYAVSCSAYLSFFVCLLYAMSDEWHQSFVPGRSAQPMDVAVDMAGVLIAAFMQPYFLALKSFCSRTRS